MQKFAFLDITLPHAVFEMMLRFNIGGESQGVGGKKDRMVSRRGTLLEGNRARNSPAQQGSRWPTQPRPLSQGARQSDLHPPRGSGRAETLSPMSQRHAIRDLEEAGPGDVRVRAAGRSGSGARRQAVSGARQLRFRPWAATPTSFVRRARKAGPKSTCIGQIQLRTR